MKAKRKPLSNAERQARFRKRSKESREDAGYLRTVHSLLWDAISIFKDEKGEFLFLLSRPGDEPRFLVTPTHSKFPSPRALPGVDRMAVLRCRVENVDETDIQKHMVMVRAIAAPKR